MSPHVLGVIGHHALGTSDRLSAAVDEALDRIEQHMHGPLVLLASLTTAVERLAVRRVWVHADGPDAGYGARTGPRSQA